MSTASLYFRVLLFVIFGSTSFQSAALAQTAINSGQTVNGSVTGAGTQSWTFQGAPRGTSAQVCAAIYELTGGVNFRPYVLIYNPDGTVLHGAYGSGTARACWNMSQTGSYTVTAKNYYGSYYPTLTGTFTINLAVDGQPFYPSGSGGMTTAGVPASGSIVASNVDLWTFVANSGDLVTVTMTDEGSNDLQPGFTIYNPDGTEESGNYGAGTVSRSIKVQQTGTYLVFAFNANNAYPTSTNAYTLTASGMSALPQIAKPNGQAVASGDCGCHADPKTGKPNAGDPAVGAPITLGTGNMFESVTDYTSLGPNPLAFIRYYNSRGNLANTYPSALGVNWRSNFDRYLRFATSSLVQAERPDGQVINFELASGVWTSDSDIDYKLRSSGSTWTLTGPDDTAETYTASGMLGTLDTIRLRNGYTQTLTYTGTQLSLVVDSYSRELKFTYESGRLDTVTTPDSLILTFAYTAVNSANRLTSISYNTAPVTSQTYLYEDAGLAFALTGIIDENDHRFATWTYDGLGRATSSQHAGGADLTQVSYDDTTGNRTVTNALGQEETYKFTILQGVPKVTEIDRAANGPVMAATRTFAYDPNGYLKSGTDWNGNSTTYINNTHGEPTTINEAVGSTVARTTTIVYDTTWVHLPHTVTTTGMTTTNTYDPTYGNLLTKVLTDTTTTTVPYSTKGQTRTWTYTYTSTGQLHSVQLPRTDVTAKTTYNYTGGILTSIVDPLGHTTTIDTYTSGGRPLTITDPNSVLTTLAYDGRLNLHTKVVTISGGSLTTTWDHDAADNLTELRQRDGTYVIYGYDAAHRLDSIKNANGEYMPLTLDAAGDVTKILWQTAGLTTKREHDATFDPAGRKLTDIGGMSQTTTYRYDSNGNITSIKTPLTWTAEQAFDGLNRLEAITDAYSHTTVTTYDAHDRALTVTDPNSHTTTYVYDGFGEAIQVSSPDTGTTVYQYDKDGNVSQKTDSASQVTNWTYDALDRPVTRTYPTDSTLNVAWTYDQSGHGKGITHLTSLTDQAGSLSLTFDESGNVLTNARTINATTYTTTYTYNAQRTIATITYPRAGWIAAYNRDAAGQVTGVTTTRPGHSAVSLVSSVTHMPVGPVESLTWGNGVIDSRKFDNDYRMTGLTDTASAAIQSLTYGYDADNNLHTITDAVHSSNSQTLSYDHLERLTGAVGGSGGYGTLSYSYDNNGNRTSDTGTTYTISSTSNHITAIGSTSVSYFGTGNISAIGTASLGYNKANQLSSASAGGSSGTYKYDAFGQRLTVTPSGYPAQIYNYDLAGNMLTETDNSIEFDYIYLDGQPIAVIEPSTAAISYIHPDRLGTPALATNSSKAAVWQQYYKPFGPYGTPTGSITQTLRFPGQYADNTGLMHNGFRDYNPTMGRYIESDPIGLNAGTNVYAYVGSNPQTWKDRLGLLDIEFDKDDVFEQAAEGIGDLNDQIESILEQRNTAAALQQILGGHSYLIVPMGLTQEQSQQVMSLMPPKPSALKACTPGDPSGKGDQEPAFVNPKSPPDFIITVRPWITTDGTRYKVGVMKNGNRPMN